MVVPIVPLGVAAGFALDADKKRRQKKSQKAFEDLNQFTEPLLRQAAERRAEREKNEALVREGLQDQLSAARAGVERVERAGRVGQQQAVEEGALARTRLATPRGFGSGAAALGAGQIAAQTARARRDIEAKTGLAMTEAEKAEATAKKAVATEREELAKARDAEAQAARDALAAAETLFNTAVNDVYVFFTMDDRKKAARKIRQQILAGETNEAVIRAVENYLKQTVLNPNHDAGGKADLG
jgi:hypothetical protein|tara:strand:+ start:1684 stop:2409 length:726 start_codon:yes stop_codon:yes gene_type:complete